MEKELNTTKKTPEIAVFLSVWELIPKAGQDFFQNSWDLPANGEQSTCSLVEIYNKRERKLNWKSLNLLTSSGFPLTALLRRLTRPKKRKVILNLRIWYFTEFGYIFLLAFGKTVPEKVDKYLEKSTLVDLRHILKRCLWSCQNVLLNFHTNNVWKVAKLLKSSPRLPYSIDGKHSCCIKIRDKPVT